MYSSTAETEIAMSLLQLQRLPSPSPSPPPMDKKRKLPPPIDTDLHAETPRLSRRRLSEFDPVSLDTNKRRMAPAILKTRQDGTLEVVSTQVPHVDAVRRYLEMQERKLEQAKQQAARTRLPSPTSPIEESLVVPADNVAVRRVQTTMHFGSGSKLSAVPRRVHQQVKSELKKRPTRSYNLERDPEVAELTAKLGFDGAQRLIECREQLKLWMYQRVNYGGPQRALIESKFSQLTL